MGWSFIFEYTFLMPKFFYKNLLILISIILCLGFFCLFLLQPKSAFAATAFDAVAYLNRDPGDLIGKKRMSLCWLSKRILKWEKISLRPRMNGICLLFENAQVIFSGLFVILIVIFPIYVMIFPPSIPEKNIFLAWERSTFKSAAIDLGIIVQSAPVSMRNSKFWYPYLVRTGKEMIGSTPMPNSVCFSVKGKSTGIDVKNVFAWDKADGQFCSVNTFLSNFFA